MLLRGHIPIPSQVVPIHPNHPFFELAHIDISIGRYIQQETTLKKNALLTHRDPPFFTSGTFHRRPPLFTSDTFHPPLIILSQRHTQHHPPHQHPPHPLITDP